MRKLTETGGEGGQAGGGTGANLQYGLERSWLRGEGGVGDGDQAGEEGAKVMPKRGEAGVGLEALRAAMV